MAIFTETQLDEADDIIDNMNFKVADEYDNWYPTIDELEERLNGKSKNDALFLMWLCNPAKKLTPEQDVVRKYATKMLYRPNIVSIKD